MSDTELEHGDYIVYVDESGDHSLESINPRYPLFVLAFCIFQKDHYIQHNLPFEIIIADKKTNSIGLQIADIAARPIGLSVLRPDQPNRAFAILEKKLYQESGRELGPFIFP